MKWLLLLLLACSAPTRSVPPPSPPSDPGLELVETQPVETTLDSELRDAHTVWLEMIASAKTSIDFAEFYASNAPNSRLETILRAIEAAIKRGVRVQFLAEITFVRVYSDTLDRLQKAGATIRTLDLSTTTRGILHAKYFIVDGSAAFLGSQNFDWRALEHIQELGVRITDRRVVLDLAKVFATDWAHAGNERLMADAWKDDVVRGELKGGPRPPPSVSLVASPKDSLPSGVRWDLPELVAMLESARSKIRIQLLTYRADDDGVPWRELEQPLLDAAARGVRVELLLADWSKREKTIGGLQKLARVPNIDIRLVTIPEHSSGFIPFARVIHAKLLVVDRERAWLGTSNWERDYFYASRNVGLFIHDGAFVERIAKFSDATWSSSYATRLEPYATYTPPRIE